MWDYHAKIFRKNTNNLSNQDLIFLSDFVIETDIETKRH